jgi:hypothetical protein
MSNRVFFVPLSWPAQFLLAAFFGFASLLAVVFIFAALEDRHAAPEQRLWLTVGMSVCAPLFLYMSIGAFKNGVRALKAVWNVQYRWKD